MTSEIRTNSITSRAGLSTVTLTDSGPMFSGITTFVDNSTFSVGTGGTIHAPATNTLNIGVNNTESLRIDSNSNLKVAGIGTFSGNFNVGGTPPWAQASGNHRMLSVSGNTTDGIAFLNLGNGAATTNADFDLTRIRIYNGATEVARITGETGDSNNDSGQIMFDTKESGGSLTERLIINREGHLLPSTDSNYNIGSTTVKFANGYFDTLYGDGSNLTGISAGTSLSGSTNNTLVTVTGANAITGESTLTYNGSDTFELQPASATPAIFIGDSNRTGANQGLAQFRGNWNGTTVARITFDTGDDTTNKDDGIIRFDTAPSGSLAERLRITREGYLFVRDNGVTQTNTTLSYQSEGAFITHYTARTTAGGDRYRRMLDIASVGANPHGSSIRLLTSPDDTNPATTVERVRIDHNGRVGINKSQPATMLSIKAERSAVPRFGIDGHYSDSSYTQSTWDDSNGLYTLLGVNHKLDANGNDATPVSSLHSASIFLDGRSGNIRFYVKPDSGTSFTEPMRISDTGVVSIGAAYSQGGANPQLSMYGSSGRQFKIMNSGANTTGMQMQNSTTGYGEDAGVQFACLGGGHTYLVNQYNGADFLWYSRTGGSSKHIFTIYDDGKIANQTNTDNLMLSNSQDGSGSNYFLRGSKNSTTPGGGNDCVWIYEDGDIRNNNNSYGQQSDIKLKENIVDAGTQWDDIKNLKVRKFNFKASTGFDTHTQIGLIAQEAELVSPGLVKEVKDRVKTEQISEVDGSTSYKESLSETEKTKHVMYSVLYMKAIKALQEAMTRIETLEQDNIALRVRVTNLEGN